MNQKKSRKILIIVENLPVPFDTRVWQEATTLAANGYTVSVICPKGKGYVTEEEFLEGVHIFRHDLSTEGNGALSYLKEYTTALKCEIQLAKRYIKKLASMLSTDVILQITFIWLRNISENMALNMSLIIMIYVQSYLKQSLEGKQVCCIGVKSFSNAGPINIVSLHL